MTMTVDLTEDMVQRLREQASQRGQEPSEVLNEMVWRLLLTPDSRLSPRIAGLNRGQIQTSEDFDAPLPDSFWLGSA